MTSKALLATALSITLALTTLPVHAETPAAPLNGADLFKRKCSACHQLTGQGIPGAFPALAGDKFVLTKDDREIIKTVLNGRGGMPSFAASTDDATLAAILTYIRSSWGNHAPAVTVQTVSTVRKSIPGGVSNAIGN